MVDPKIKAMVDHELRKRAAFIKPKREPCNHIDCLVYNEFGQCPDCGWLQPLKSDLNPWKLPIREIPLGRGGICMLGLSEDDAEYIREHLH
jgi:hypothetical protein